MPLPPRAFNVRTAYSPPLRPGGKGCPTSAAFRAGDRRGHLCTAAERPCRKGASAALPGRVAAERQRRGGDSSGSSGAAEPERSAAERAPPPSAGRAGGTMITSAGEGAARGRAVRRGFAESGP